MRVEIGRFRRIGHRVLEILQFVMQRAETAAAGDRLVEHAAAGHLLDVLPEVADGETLRNRHVAVVRRLLAGDQAEERRLSGSVRPDETDLFAGIELKGRVDEQKLLAVLLGQSMDCDHSEETGGAVSSSVSSRRFE